MAPTFVLHYIRSCRVAIAKCPLIQTGQFSKQHVAYTAQGISTKATNTISTKTMSPTTATHTTSTTVRSLSTTTSLTSTPTTLSKSERTSTAILETLHGCKGYITKRIGKYLKEEEEEEEEEWVRRDEEEELDNYRAEDYYPVDIGQVFHDRYKVVGKLGFGTKSTVWLCRDLSEEYLYVALKVCINSLKVHREVPMYRYIEKLQLNHDGRKHVRKLIESFEIQGPHGTHTCLVHEPLGTSLVERAQGCSDYGVALRAHIRIAVLGLMFLHKAHIIHASKSKQSI